MTPLNLIAVSLFAFGLVACDNARDTLPASGDTAATPMDIAEDNAMHHAGHKAGNGGIGHAFGTIRSVDDEQDFLTIEHGPFEGIAMGAMTMGFGIMGGVDLSRFSEGDEVEFMVKQGRDASYRIMAICKKNTDGANCLDGVMDHQESNGEVAE
ncbi:copper-binding protein [Henriciella barbarensis]|nr:copper-binding protein [Henriciella barbarensis]